MDKIDFMKLAIREAEKAAAEDEVPVGAVLVRDGKVLAKAHNRKEKKNCAVFHAEIEAIVKACKKTGNWYLDNTELYVTLEPCPMCVGAIINSRIEKLYFGAWDPKAGCCGSKCNLVDMGFNHRFTVEGGLMESECAALLGNFFKEKRKRKQP